MYVLSNGSGTKWDVRSESFCCEGTAGPSSLLTSGTFHACSTDTKLLY